MKTKKLNRKLPGYVLVVVAAAFVCWDLATSSSQYTEEGTYRLLSEFNAISSATPYVAIVPSDYSDLSKSVSRDTDPGFSHIQEMLDMAIELQGGFDAVIDKEDVVMIKVNLVGEDSPSGQGENTDVRVVKALIKNIYEFTEGEVEIIVAEGTARDNDDPNTAGSVWENSGYTDLLNDSYLKDINFRLLNLNQSSKDMIEIDLGSKGTSAPQGYKYHVHKEEVEADVYIAVPVLKIHDTGITNALKLQIGTAPGCYYGYNKKAGNIEHIEHDVDHRRWTTEAIVDLSKVADIDFVVVDAIMCLESYKSYKGNNQVRFNTIVAGYDPVAVDHVCAKMMGLNPDDIAHITLAEKVGLGSNQEDKIVIKGATIDDVKKTIIKNTSENGRFGQSNRTWLMSKAYSGESVEAAAISNEASLIPKPDQDDWTQPIYFFDDRLDLSSYYNGQTDIVSYAFTYFYSPKDQEAELWLGSHEGIIVYLNKEKVYSFNSTNSYGSGDIGEEEADINIKKGENTLLVKTFNGFGDYSFALNICEKTSNTNINGNRVEGLKFYTSQAQNPILVEKKNDSEDYKLEVYPNPCSTMAEIVFTLPAPTKVGITIYDIDGRIVERLKDDYFDTGENRVQWNLLSNGKKVMSGTYVCMISSGKYRKSAKIIVNN
jgi:uncharacterized protein (DUF362 family)